MEEIMAAKLTEQMVETIRLAAQKLTGFNRRQFQAETALAYCDGSPRKAETVFGWARDTVNTGLNELCSGIRCLDNFSARGRKRSEEVVPQLEQDIREIVEPQTQADPKFQTPLAFTRITAKAVREALIEKQPHTGPGEPAVPAERTVLDILNRLGYQLQRVRKTRPEKKFPKPTRSSPTSTQLTSDPRMTRSA
jgi:hypothetical protein